MRSAMPRDMSEEAVARWVASTRAQGFDGPSGLLVLGSDRALARAVIDFVRAKVREAVGASASPFRSGKGEDDIVARVMGEEAPRA